MILAQASDLPEIQKLLVRNKLPIDDVSINAQQFFISKEGEKIAGTAALELYNKHAIFRSFAVDSEYQNQGIGKKLHDETILYASERGIESLYLLTTTADSYFEKHGWIRIPRERVPKVIEKSDEFSNICPSSAICMCFILQEGPVKEAVNTFILGFNCAQSVLAAFAPQLGLNKNTALKIATGFNAGINRKGDLCGAVSGAYMALGLKYGRSDIEDTKARERTSSFINEYDKKFIQRNNYLTCRKLLQGDVSKADEYKILQENNAFVCTCPNLVKDSAEILNELLTTQATISK